MLLFNGSRHNKTNSFNQDIYNYLYEQCEQNDLSVREFDLSEVSIPQFDPFARSTPPEVFEMIELFREEELQIWLAPLYHGSIPGVMKNALDWLELTSNEAVPYLSDKKVGMICIADGLFAIQGINAMNAIAHTLRAWVLPYSIPINKSEAQIRNPQYLSRFYQSKIEMMTRLIKKEKVKSAESKVINHRPNE